MVKAEKYTLEIKPNKYTRELYPREWNGSKLELTYDRQVMDGILAHCECCGKERKSYHVFLDDNNCEYMVGTECAKKYISKC